MPLNREELLAGIASRAKDLTKLDIPEWGGEVFVRRMSSGDVDRTGLSSGTRDAGVIGKVLVASIVDEDGAPLFQEGDLPALEQADIATVARVFAEVISINGLGDEDLEAALQDFKNAQHRSSSSS